MNIHKRVRYLPSHEAELPNPRKLRKEAKTKGRGDARSRKWNWGKFRFEDVLPRPRPDQKEVPYIMEKARQFEGFIAGVVQTYLFKEEGLVNSLARARQELDQLNNEVDKKTSGPNWKFWKCLIIAFSTGLIEFLIGFITFQAFGDSIMIIIPFAMGVTVLPKIAAHLVGKMVRQAKSFTLAWVISGLTVAALLGLAAVRVYYFQEVAKIVDIKINPLYMALVFVALSLLGYVIDAYASHEIYPQNTQAWNALQKQKQLEIDEKQIKNTIKEIKRQEDAEKEMIRCLFYEIADIYHSSNFSKRRDNPGEMSWRKHIPVINIPKEFVDEDIHVESHNGSSSEPNGSKNPENLQRQTDKPEQIIGINNRRL